MFDAKYELTEVLRKARDYAQERADENGGIFCLNDQADYLLANDVELVVHARWEIVDITGFGNCTTACCSHCKKPYGQYINGNKPEWKRCPECGAKMDLKE